MTARRILAGGTVTLAVALSFACRGSAPATNNAPAVIPIPAADGRGVLRLSGTVEAVQARTVSVPRLQGPLTPLVIIGLVKAGTRVKPGDPLVEFDPQQQQRDAFDRRADLINLDGELAKKQAEQAAKDATDKTELSAAEHDVDRARLEVRKNELIPKIDAEKNTLTLTQAEAKFNQLKITYALKREAATAELKILQIRRDRAERALKYSESNAHLMSVAAPFGGLVVIKRMYRNGNFVEMAEGDSVRPGTPIVDIVDTSVMRVRARLNQADFRFVHAGQHAKIGLDGFPDLSFDGEVTMVTPLAASSQLSTTVRSFVVVISVKGNNAQLLPDLTASVDIVPDEAPVTKTASSGS